MQPDKNTSRRSSQRGSTVSWKQVVAVLAERYERPAAVLDPRLRVRFVSQRLEKLLGHAPVDEPWEAILGGAQPSPRLADSVRNALRGIRTSNELVMRRPDDQSVSAVMECAPLGAPACGVLLSITAASPVVLADLPLLPDGVTYVVACSPSKFGALESVSGDVPNGLKRAKGEICHRILYGRDLPCDGCPALRLSTTAEQETVVLEPTEGGPFQVVTAKRIDSQRVRLKVVSISEATLSHLLQARIARLALRAGLSPRERDVLQLLVLGRSFREVGEILGIRERTVKFHQANLLEKLGADARSDLLRLIL